MFELESGSRAGFAQLTGINWTSRNAWFDAFLSRPYVGKRLAVESGELLLRYAFEELNLHRVQSSVLAVNAPALAASQRIGMEVEATLKLAGYIQGQYHDVILLAALRSTWRERTDRRGAQ